MTSPRAEASAPPSTSFDAALWRLSIVVMLGGIMTILDTTIVNVAIDTLGRQFDASLSTIQWVLTGYALALSMTIPVTGWAVERFGGKRVWMVSLTLFITGSVLCGAAWSTGSLIAFRVLQGVGGGMIIPVGQTMLAQAAGQHRMGRVMSVISVPAMLAPMLGPVMGGTIVDHLNWRWMFYINVPVCGVAVLLAAFLLPPDSDRQRTRRLDVTGLLLLAVGLAALIYGMSEAGNGTGLSSLRVLCGLLAGIGLITVFTLYELRKTDQPLINLRLFRFRNFTSAVGTLFFYSTALGCLLVMVPLYLQIVRSESPMDAGLVLAPLGVGAIITMPFSGRITDRYGPRWVAVTGVTLAVLGSLEYTQVATDTSKIVLAAAVFVIGLGHGLAIPALTAAPYRGLDKSDLPGATVTSNILIRVATSFGYAVLATILQTYIRSEIPGAGGTIEGAARAIHTRPGTDELVARAFQHTAWWAIGIAVIALTSTFFVVRRPPPGKTVPLATGSPEKTAR